MKVPTEDQVEQARAAKGVPADWTWEMCDNFCGGFVFMPADAREVAEAVSTPFRVFCTNACAIDYIRHSEAR